MIHKRIVSYQNRRGDIQADVRVTPNGSYAVTVYDLDAAATLPAARHFKTEAKAIAYALKCVTAEDDNELPL